MQMPGRRSRVEVRERELARTGVAGSSLIELEPGAPCRSPTARSNRDGVARWRGADRKHAVVCGDAVSAPNDAAHTLRATDPVPACTCAAASARSTTARRSTSHARRHRDGTILSGRAHPRLTNAGERRSVLVQIARRRQRGRPRPCAGRGMHDAFRRGLHRRHAVAQRRVPVGTAGQPSRRGGDRCRRAVLRQWVARFRRLMRRSVTLTPTLSRTRERSNRAAPLPCTRGEGWGEGVTPSGCTSMLVRPLTQSANSSRKRCSAGLPRSRLDPPRHIVTVVLEVVAVGQLGVRQCRDPFGRG